MDKYKVVFTPSGKRGEFSRNSNLLDIARSLGVDIDSVCGGRGICGRCQVEPSEGDFRSLKLMLEIKTLVVGVIQKQNIKIKKVISKTVVGLLVALC